MWTAATCALALCLPQERPATRFVAPPANFVVVLRDPTGKPVADADVALVTHEPGVPTALAWFTELAQADAEAMPALQPAARLWTRSDERGRASVPAMVGDAATANGMVTTASGLGAVVVGLQPGRPQRLALAPLAAVTTVAGDETLRVHARLRTGDDLVTLPCVAGASPRLPAGEHDLWVRTRRGWNWRRLALAHGQTVALPDEPAARRVQRPGPGWQLLPEGRADVPLFADGEDTVALCGAAAAATFVAWHAASGRVLPAQAVPDAPAGDAAAWPVPNAATAFVDGLADAPTGTDAHEALALMQRTAAGDWLPVGIATARSEGPDFRRAFELPLPPAGDCWLVHVRRGRAPHAAPYRSRGAAATDAGRDLPLTVRVRLAGGAPVADVALAYEPDGMPAAATSCRSDEFGRGGFGPVAAPGTVRVVDARFANRSIVLTAPTAAPLDVEVEVGAMLRGVANWSDGAPAVGVVVTLRDPSGALTPAARTVATANDGSFAFAGLREGRGYVLFAAARRDGRTWSGRGETRAGDETPFALLVRDEDPAFAPPKAR